MTPDILEILSDKGFLSELDVHFSRFILRISDRPSAELGLAAALADHATRQGHTCVNLSKLGGHPLPDTEDGTAPVVCPDADTWLEAVRSADVVGAPGDRKPLIMGPEGRLYLYRYWEYQHILAQRIARRVRADDLAVDSERLKSGLDRLFGPWDHGQADGPPKSVDWQRVAAAVALLKRFCIISGGPGTGKTTTVAKILALTVEQSETDSLKIALAAPTGKAAARLQQAVKAAKAILPCEGACTDRIPEEATTLHRLLGAISGSPYFRHHAGNVLPVDVVVVDEASMVDLALMSKLVQALDDNTRLILLGDKNQLASVEAGAVLADLCAASRNHGLSKAFVQRLQHLTGQDIPSGNSARTPLALSECIIELRENYRFSNDSGINTLSHTINKGRADQAVDLLKTRKHPDLSWTLLPARSALRKAVQERILPAYSACFEAKTVEEYFRRFDRFRVLCALREGPFGVAAMNTLIEDGLAHFGLISREGAWYRGRPVLITRNHYTLNLYNGDIGIAWPDRQTHELRVFFPTPDGKLKHIHPIRLPEHETAFAMTVHKSQGSEFDEVLVILPDKDAPVLTRELLYTAVTRARKRAVFWARPEIIHNAVDRPTRRSSGLRDALLQALGPRSSRKK